MIKSLSGLALAGLAAAVYLVVVVPVLLVGIVLTSFGGATAVAATAAAVVAAECAPFLFAAGGGTAGPAQIGQERFTGEQLAHARTIITVAEQRRLPRRAAVLAVATAMVESDLRNLGYGDRDSLGLFQQRPSQGWGSPEQILNPVYAAGKFYDHLVALPGWQTMPPGVAEQAVQRSAFPERYGPREPAAAALVERFWTGPDHPAPPATDTAVPPSSSPINYAFGACPDVGRGDLDVDEHDRTTLPEDYTPPTDPTLHAAVTYALAQVGKPYVWGAEGPDAFDCSGLMQAAWASAGVAISRTTSTQVHDGVAVASLAQVQPGDLVFIPGADGTPAAPGHVGMYVGDGYMVDAYDSDHGVILTTLDSWKSKVVAIRRVATGGHRPPTGGGDPRS